MTDIFVSYRRPDIERVRQLVAALEKKGFSVWWDQELAGGENWRRRIEEALGKAKVVVAVWSEEAVGRSGGFVRDEATRALAENRLVPCRIDRVEPPLGFGEIQAIDLSDWNGRSKNVPGIEELSAAVRAKIDGTEVDLSAVVETSKKRQNIRRGAIVGAVLFAAVGLFDLFSSNSMLCRSGGGISDLCGTAGIGGRPTKTERLALSTIEDGDCKALQKFITDYPKSAVRQLAVDLYAARSIENREEWVDVEHRLPLYVPSDDTGSASEEAARSDAMTRGRIESDRVCKSFANSGIFRFSAAQVDPKSWNCGTAFGGISCAIDGEAVCSLEEMQTVEVETCEISALQ